MQKRALLLVVFILTFTMFYNMVSFYLLYSFDKQQKWVAEVEDSRKSQFHIIKLNASLYSFADDTDFELVNQDVIIGDKSFHVFKKRIKDNILELYVLNNLNETALDVNLSNLAEVDFDDNSDLSKSPLKKLLKSISFDYILENKIDFKNNISYNLQSKFNFWASQNITNGFTSVPFSPPKNLG